MSDFQKIVVLHPRANGGEASIAHLSLNDRQMLMTIITNSYGLSETKTTVSFDSPKDIQDFAIALMALADFSQAFFKKDP